jgi:hypothetical protein
MALTLKTWVGVFKGVSEWLYFERAVWKALLCLLILNIPDIIVLWEFNSEIWIRNVKNKRIND